jgi:hypothetical protein
VKRLGDKTYTFNLEVQEKSQLKAIAHAINVSESTVCREIKRHGGSSSGYNWVAADEMAKRMAIYIFNNRIEVISTGGLPNNLSRNDFLLACRNR